jgi:hypothetical protein
LISSSWPGLTRPSTTSLLMCSQDVDARVKPGHDELMYAGISRPGVLGFEFQAPTIQQTQLRDLAACNARGLHRRCPSKKKREQGMPGARCTRGLMCQIVQRNAHEHTGTVGGTPAFPAQWLYGLCHARRRIRLVTVIGGLKVLSRPVGPAKTSADLTPATGARTTRFCRTQPPVVANRLRPKPDFGGSRKAQRALAPSSCMKDIAHGINRPAISASHRRCRVHRIPSQRS